MNKGGLRTSAMSEWFRNLRIHSRLHLISFVLFASVLALGSAYLYGDRAIGLSLDRQTQYIKLSHLAHNIEIAYLQMQRAEKNFLSQHDYRYVEEYNAAATEVEKAFAQEIIFADNDTIKQHIKHLKGVIDHHKENFSVIHQLYSILGLNESQGLQGKFREAVHKIEMKLQTVPPGALRVKLLMMRRHEKDYILRGEDKYVRQLGRRIEEFNVLLGTSQFSANDRNLLRVLLEIYQSRFRSFVHTSKLISKNTLELNGIYREMIPGFQAIFDDAAKGRKQAATSVVSTRHYTTNMLLAAVVFVLLISTSLVHIIGKGIAAPLRKHTDTLKRLAQGDTSIDISDVELENEIGAMARAMQIFRDNAFDHMWVKDAKQRLEKIAYFDALTGLANRAHCQKDLAETFAFSANDDKFAIIQIDLDNFKRVNDTLGHAAGDHLLQVMGTRLNFLQKDFPNFTPYRWGGDEFIVLVRRDDDTNMEGICQELTDLISIPLQFEGSTLRPTVSLGVARFPEDGNDIAALMIFADLALYKTKELGRDGYQFFTAEMKERIDTENRIEQELRVAIDEGQLELFFQPQIDIHDETISGIEALVRWNHPKRGLLVPGDFLDIAEVTGLAPALGCAIFDESMKAIRHLTDHGLDFGRLAVNLSPEHLKKKTILDDLFASMNKYNVEPKFLAVEFLESFLLDDPNANLANILYQLRTRGIHVELDDFGTGYASLSHLSKMPINGLKIDRSFINQMVEDDKQKGIVAALISISKLLELRVVCEGIETQQQLDIISQIGNCAIQGYFVAKPMSLAHITEWIGNKSNIGMLNQLPHIDASNAQKLKV